MNDQHLAELITQVKSLRADVERLRTLEDRLTRGARVSASVTQSIPGTGALTQVLFPTVDYDASSFFTTSPDHRFVVPANFGGYYLFTLKLTWAAVGATTAWRYSAILLNDGTSIATDLRQAVNPIQTQTSIAGAVLLSPGQFVRAFAAQNEGVNVNLDHTSTSLGVFTITWLGGYQL